MGARDRVGKGLSYRPTRQHSLAELVLTIDSWIKSLKIRALDYPSGFPRYSPMDSTIQDIVSSFLINKN
jgi:hypothetical protein